MKKIGISIDYGNICTDYNTVYLDRDNTDSDTFKCMTAVMQWLKPFLSELMEAFDYSIYRMNQKPQLKLEDIVQKRFLFYSLEKALTPQTFILEKESKHYVSLPQWAADGENSLLIQNDDEGECLYFYFDENSAQHEWLKEKLGELALDVVPFKEA